MAAEELYSSCLQKQSVAPQSYNVFSIVNNISGLKSCPHILVAVQVIKELCSV